MARGNPKLREHDSGAVILTLSKPTLRDAGLVDEDGHLIEEYQTAQRVNEKEGRIEIDLLETKRVGSLGEPTD